jgi:sigma-B regulation protein RsbU (phosphoserine phosphatase)
MTANARIANELPMGGAAVERKGSMTILIADDDAVSRCMLQTKLAQWGYEIILAADGSAALDILERPDAPELAILDWIMPGLEGLQVCERIRSTPRDPRTYIIMLTIKGAKDDIVAGLNAGADDYLAKPFDWEELRARLQVGLRMVELQHSLAQRIHDLEESQAKLKTLQGLLPICGYCKKIRDDKNYWSQIEAYLSAHADVHFSHGVCPNCFETIVKPEMEKQFGIKVNYKQMRDNE